MTTFTPRPLRPGERPAPGDVFFQRGSQLPSILIRFGTGSDINHAGIILGVAQDAGVWSVAEANAPGFEVAWKEHADAYVVRVSDVDADRARLAAAALDLTDAGLRYDYLAVVRFALIVLARCRPSTLIGKVLLGVPLLVLRTVARLALVVLPAERPDRVICSGAVRRLLRDTFGEGTWALGLPVRDDETSPAALLRAIYGRRRW